MIFLVLLVIAAHPYDAMARYDTVSVTTTIHKNVVHILGECASVEKCSIMFGRNDEKIVVDLSRHGDIWFDTLKIVQHESLFDTVVIVNVFAGPREDRRIGPEVGSRPARELTFEYSPRYRDYVRTYVRDLSHEGTFVVMEDDLCIYRESAIHRESKLKILFKNLFK